MGTVTGSYDYNAICDVCGFKYKASQLKKRWDGFMVCKDDYETRHPMDFYRSRNDQHALPWTRSEPPERYSAPGNFAYVGCAMAGVSVVGKGLI